jgi:hypothetical protein
MMLALTLGRIVLTRGALMAVPPDDLFNAVRRHARGDWGQVSADDQASNDRAVQTGERVLSAYCTSEKLKFWIITEWDRSITTVLLPEEY